MVYGILANHRAKFLSSLAMCIAACGAPSEQFAQEISSVVQTATATPVCTPPPSGIVAWWPGDGTSDDIHGGNNATLLNGVTFAPGQVQDGFRFDGIDDSGFVPDAPSLHVPGAFTLETWVNTASQQATDFGAAIVEREGSEDGAAGFNLRIDSSGTRYRCNIDSGPADFNAFSTTPTSPGAWQHVACTFDGSTLRIYVNGALEGSTSAPVIVDTSQPIFIGEGPSATVPFQGLIDEVTLYNRALRADEIYSIFASGSAGKCRPIKLPWASGDTWYLTSGPHGGHTVDDTYAIDFAPATDPADPCTSFNFVLAAGAGVIHLGPNTVQIEHPDHTATNYFHVDPTTLGLRDGQPVLAGQPIGFPSCDGGHHEGGAHVHFYRSRCSGIVGQRLSCRERIQADGMQISGWTVHREDPCVRRFGSMRCAGTMTKAGEVTRKKCPSGTSCIEGRTDLVSDNEVVLSP